MNCLFPLSTNLNPSTIGMSQPPVQESGPLNLLRPLYLLYCSGWYIPHTIYNLVSTPNLQPLTSISTFKDHWFARFWTWFGPRSRDNAAAKVMPLLANNARGVILDIGPGTGQWLYLFAAAMNPDVRKIYGVEPNAGLHSQLRESAVKAGLGEVYEIIGCGAEELGSVGGIEEGSVDTIVTVQCLCSIPGPERVIRDLYPLLKPGGKWLVYEHVKTKYQGDFVAFWQRELFSKEKWTCRMRIANHLFRCYQRNLAAFLWRMQHHQADGRVVAHSWRVGEGRPEARDWREQVRHYPTCDWHAHEENVINGDVFAIYRMKAYCS